MGTPLDEMLAAYAGGSGGITRVEVRLECLNMAGKYCKQDTPTQLIAYAEALEKYVVGDVNAG